MGTNMWGNTIRKCSYLIAKDNTKKGNQILTIVASMHLSQRCLLMCWGSHQTIPQILTMAGLDVCDFEDENSCSAACHRGGWSEPRWVGQIEKISCLCASPNTWSLCTWAMIKPVSVWVIGKVLDLLYVPARNAFRKLSGSMKHMVAPGSIWPPTVCCGWRAWCCGGINWIWRD
jgi:hypothetical protein